MTANFLRLENSAGIIMIGVSLLAIILANSPLYLWYEGIIEIPVNYRFNGLPISLPFSALVKDGLMILFFLLIGLELKHEILAGYLKDKRQIILPFFAALGGVLIPAIIFILINMGDRADLNGWAIPSATDIAFAMAVLSLFGPLIPQSVKIFLLAIAIFDDLFAIIAIALFYSGGVDVLYLFLSALVAFALFYLKRFPKASLWLYILLGILLCYFLHCAGIHSTIGGVITGFAVPLKGDNGRTPLSSLMQILHKPVSFFILPLFGFTSAGVNFINATWSEMFNSLSMGIIIGLFLGKQLGIFSTAWFIVKMKIADLPQHANFLHLYIASIVAGIGFTMSLFIGLLAFGDEPSQNAVKFGVILGSLLSAAMAFLIVKIKFGRYSSF